MELQEEILDQQALADLLKSAVTTIKRMVSNQPEQLPPFVNLGTAKRAVPRWKKSTVLEWFAAREGVATTRIAPIVHTRGRLPIKQSTRPRGRPRKVAMDKLEEGRGKL